MAGERNYTIRVRYGEDGTQYVLIREVPPVASRWPLRHWASALAARLMILKAGFQKALKFAGRRA